MSTGLYNSRISERITGDLGHRYSVTVMPRGGSEFELDVEAATVTLSEDWTPHIQAAITAVVPDDPALLEAIDPRLNCRLRIDAGYVYEDAGTDIQLLADVHLRTRTSSRPANEMTLDGVSDEGKALDRLRTASTGLPAFTGVNDAVLWFADYAVKPDAVNLWTDFGPNDGAASVAGLEVDAGTTMWNPIEDVASRAGVWVHCTTDRKWRIRNRPERGDAIVHSLTVGKDGTLLASGATLDRNIFYNEALLEYVWRNADGTDQRIYGRARVTSGDYSATQAGTRTFYQRYDRAISQSQADAAAGTKVRNLITRGRSLELTAHAAYWLRPGDTISVQLLTGTAEKHLVKSITFDLNRGLMTIQTRQPLDVTITTGE